MKIILIISTVMIALVLSQSFQECLDESIQCYYKVTPTPVCGINAYGETYTFIDPCEFNYMNTCLGPDDAFSEIKCECKADSSSLEKCLKNLVVCNYLYPSTPVCGVNCNGVEQEFAGGRELSKINECVGSEGAFRIIPCPKAAVV